MDTREHTVEKWIGLLMILGLLNGITPKRLRRLGEFAIESVAGAVSGGSK